MKKTTILALGDFTSSGEPFSLSFKRFLSCKGRLPKKFSKMEAVDYSSLLCSVYPKIYTDDILIMTFFPYNYWNDYIEIYDKDDRVYGDSHFGREFKSFFENIEVRIRRYYRGHRLHFVNSLKNIAIDRDKKKTKYLLSKNKIPVPKLFRFEKIDQVKRVLGLGTNLYVKPRYGAMGKGMTFLSQERWMTNFRFENNKIVSKPSDYGWTFKNIRGNAAFLKELIRRDFLFEEAIIPAKAGKKRFDLRVYGVCSKVPYIYARSTKAGGVITNWAQGGRIESKKFLKKIPKDKVDLAEQYAIRAAEVLDFNFTGVDVLLSENYENVYVLEVQSFPGFERGFDLIKFLINHI